jgi:hypothetical protein
MKERFSCARGGVLRENAHNLTKVSREAQLTRPHFHVFFAVGPARTSKPEQARHEGVEVDSRASDTSIRIKFGFAFPILIAIEKDHRGEISARLRVIILFRVAGGSLMGLVLVFWANGGSILNKLLGG